MAHVAVQHNINLSINLSLCPGAPPPYDGGYGSLPPPPPYYNTAGHPPPSSSSQQRQQQPIIVQPAHVCHAVVVQRRPVIAVSLPPPPDFMCLAIIAIIFCFPLGLLAMAKSVKVQFWIGRVNSLGNLCIYVHNVHVH